MRNQYSKNETIGMKYVGTWIPPDVHEKLKQLSKDEDRNLAYLIARSIKLLAATVPDATPDPSSMSDEELAAHLKRPKPTP
jgi:hypothetical protein